MWRGLRLAFSEAPAVLLGGFVFVLSSLPWACAAALGIGWLTALTLLLPVLALTALAGWSAALLDGEARPSLLLSGDVVLALTIAAPLALGGAFISLGSWMLWLGCALIAFVLMVAPFVLAYAVEAGRGPLQTWRGALLMITLRPGWPLSLLAFTVIGAFAVLATLGVLLLVLPMVSLIVATTAVRTIRADAAVLAGAPADA